MQIRTGETQERFADHSPHRVRRWSSSSGGTATDLGDGGIDATCGTGRVKLSTAFPVVGPLPVMPANGKSVAASSINRSLPAGGALGKLSAIRSRLASCMSLDACLRNFTVDLSGLIQSRASAVRLKPLPANLKAEAATAFTQGGNGEGLLAGMTHIQSRSHGFAFMSKRFLSPDDQLLDFWKQPLRVVSGKAAVVVCRKQARRCSRNPP